jgi:hypothetical protein
MIYQLLDDFPIAFSSTRASLIVIPQFFDEEPIDDRRWFEVVEKERIDRATEELRIKMFAAGWWWATELPYEALPDGGILVTRQMLLDWETTFEQPWECCRHGCHSSPTHREAFYPPVPIQTPDYASPGWLKEPYVHVDEYGFAMEWLMFEWDYISFSA